MDGLHPGDCLLRPSATLRRRDAMDIQSTPQGHVRHIHWIFRTPGPPYYSGGRGNVGIQPFSRCIFAGHLLWRLSPARMDRYHVRDHCFQRAAVPDPGNYWRVSPSDLSRGNTTARVSGERSCRRDYTGSNRSSMTDALVKIRVSRVDGVESLAWSENLSMQLPAVVANALGNGRDFSTDITITPAAIERARAMRSKAMHESLRLRAAFTDHPPPSSRLPI